MIPSQVVMGGAILSGWCHTQQGCDLFKDHKTTVEQTARWFYRRRRRLGFVEELDEIIQRSRIGLLLAMTTFSPDRFCSLKTWIIRKIRQYLQEVSDYESRRCRCPGKTVTVREGDLVAEDQGVQDIINRDMWDIFRRQLSWTQRLLLTLRYREGWTFKEIAAVFGITESGAWFLHREVLTLLRQRFPQCADF